MESFMENPGLLHIGERILKNVPFKTKLKCRLVKRSWNQIFEKEASKAKNDLDNLIKSLKKLQSILNMTMIMMGMIGTILEKWQSMNDVKHG